MIPKLEKQSQAWIMIHWFFCLMNDKEIWHSPDLDLDRPWQDTYYMYHKIYYIWTKKIFSERKKERKPDPYRPHRPSRQT